MTPVQPVPWLSGGHAAAKPTAKAGGEEPKAQMPAQDIRLRDPTFAAKPGYHVRIVSSSAPATTAKGPSSTTPFLEPPRTSTPPPMAFRTSTRDPPAPPPASGSHAAASEEVPPVLEEEMSSPVGSSPLADSPVIEPGTLAEPVPGPMKPRVAPSAAPWTTEKGAGKGSERPASPLPRMPTPSFGPGMKAPKEEDLGMPKSGPPPVLRTTSKAAPPELKRVRVAVGTLPPAAVSKAPSVTGPLPSEAFGLSRQQAAASSEAIQRMQSALGGQLRPPPMQIRGTAGTSSGGHASATGEQSVRVTKQIAPVPMQELSDPMPPVYLNYVPPPPAPGHSQIHTTLMNNQMKRLWRLRLRESMRMQCWVFDQRLWGTVHRADGELRDSTGDAHTFKHLSKAHGMEAIVLDPDVFNAFASGAGYCPSSSDEPVRTERAFGSDLLPGQLAIMPPPWDLYPPEYAGIHLFGDSMAWTKSKSGHKPFGR